MKLMAEVEQKPIDVAGVVSEQFGRAEKLSRLLVEQQEELERRLNISEQLVTPREARR